MVDTLSGAETALPADAVTEAVPTRTAVMRPLVTVATCGFELVQLTVAPVTGAPLLVSTVAVTVTVLPEVIVTAPLAERVMVAGELSGGGGDDPPSPPPPQAITVMMAAPLRSQPSERGIWVMLRREVGM